MFLRKRFSVLTLTFIFSCGVSYNVGATPQSDFQNQANADYQLISGYVNGQFAKSIGFFSTLGWNVSPGVFSLTGFPKLEVGIGGGADIIGLSGVQNLPLQALILGNNITLPSWIPMPFPVINARVGLLNGLDVGLRFTALPPVSVSVPSSIALSAQDNGVGVDLRYKVLEGQLLPTVTVGVSWDTLNTTLSVTTPVNQNSTYMDAGTSYSASVIGTSTYTLNSNVNSFGAKLMVGKDLMEVFPFAAIGFQRNSGYVASSVTGSVVETVNGTSTTVPLNFSSSQPPVVIEPKYVLGIDIGTGMHWTLVGESNGSDIAASMGLRVQF